MTVSLRTPIRILIADKSQVVCDSVRGMLDREADIQVIGSAVTADNFAPLLEEATVALVHTTLGMEEAIALIEQMSAMRPDVKILVFGVNENPDEILCYIEAGAAGYVLQQESLDDLLTKVRAACQNQALISPGVAAILMSRLSEMRQQQETLINLQERLTAVDALSPREREVLGLLSQGSSNQEIAQQLVIEYGTVKNHVHNILRKLESNNRTEAASLFRIYQERSPDSFC
jgi:DNA-binding NarL/FixJ family response regulator